MLGSSQLMAFAATKQPEKAPAFYTEKLGLTMVANEPMALVCDSNGSMLRISVVKDFTPHPFTVLGWQVADIRSMRRELAGKGVTFENYGFPGQEGRRGHLDHAGWRAGDLVQRPGWKPAFVDPISLKPIP